jgi:hypothetical protein
MDPDRRDWLGDTGTSDVLNHERREGTSAAAKPISAPEVIFRTVSIVFQTPT